MLYYYCHDFIIIVVSLNSMIRIGLVTYKMISYICESWWLSFFPCQLNSSHRCLKLHINSLSLLGSWSWSTATEDFKWPEIMPILYCPLIRHLRPPSPVTNYPSRWTGYRWGDLAMYRSLRVSTYVRDINDLVLETKVKSSSPSPREFREAKQLEWTRAQKTGIGSQ